MLAAAVQRWITALCVLLACSLHGGAAAQEQSGTLPALNWVRLQEAGDCISAAALAERVEQRVGRGLFAATTEAELFVDGSVRATRLSQTRRAFEITLQVSRRSGEVLGERVLSIEGEACSAIDDAVSLVIAVTLDPKSSLLATGIPLAPETAASLHALFGAEPVDPDPATLPKAEPPLAQPEKIATPPRAPAPPAEPALRIGIDAIGAFGLGMLPGLRPAIGGAVRLEPRPLFPFDLALLHFVEGDADVDPGAGSVAFQLTLIALSACPWAIVEPSLRACVGLEGGRISAEPRGLPVTAPASEDLVLDGLVSAVLRPRIAGPLHLRVALTAAVPFAQRAFTYATAAGPRTLFRTAPLQGRAEIGLGVTF